MIKHIVSWNLVNKSDPEQAIEDGNQVKQLLENLNGKIPGLIHIEVGFDFSKYETAADIVLYSEFETKQALSDYLVHPLHVEVGKTVRVVCCDRRMIDYEI